MKYSYLDFQEELEEYVAEEFDCRGGWTKVGKSWKN